MAFPVVPDTSRLPLHLGPLGDTPHVRGGIAWTSACTRSGLGLTIRVGE